MVIFGAKIQISIVMLRMRLFGVIFKQYEKFVSEDFTGFHKKKNNGKLSMKKKMYFSLGKKRVTIFMPH